jgi:hypothetical protein
VRPDVRSAADNRRPDRRDTSRSWDNPPDNTATQASDTRETPFRMWLVSAQFPDQVKLGKSGH